MRCEIRSNFLGSKLFAAIICSAIVVFPGCSVKKKSVIDLVRTESSNSFNSSKNQLSLYSLYPSSGPSNGNTELNVYGSNFKSGVEVKVGGASCIDTKVYSYYVRCKTPVGTVGSAEVVVTNPGEPSVTASTRFIYELGDPIIQSISPNSGPEAGGNQVDIYGENFSSDMTVNLGWSRCGSLVIHSPTHLSCLPPARHASYVDVTVYRRSWTPSTLMQAYRYLAAPVNPTNARNAPPQANTTGNPTANTDNGSQNNNTRPPENLPTIQVLSPAMALNTGGTRLQIFGEHLGSVVEINVGAGTRFASCTGIRIHGPSHLDCVLPAMDYVGRVMVFVRNAGGNWCSTRMATLSYAPPERPTPAPANPAHGPDTQARGSQAHGPHAQAQGAEASGASARAQSEGYAGSEAEVLRRYFEIRMLNPTWIESVSMNGQTIDIGSWPRSMIRGYTILNVEIARQLGVTVGTSLSELELQALEFEQSDLVLSASHTDVEVNNNSARNPLFNPRPIAAEKEARLSHIRDRVNHALAGLGAHSPRNYYVDPGHTNSDGAFVHQFETIGGTDRQAFLAVMDSIRDGNEAEFVTAASHFASFFKADLAEARRGFIDNFTYLYVTKEFPSQGMMMTYFHFLLRCGHIH